MIPKACCSTNSVLLPLAAGERAATGTVLPRYVCSILQPFLPCAKLCVGTMYDEQTVSLLLILLHVSQDQVTVLPTADDHNAYLNTSGMPSLLMYLTRPMTLSKHSPLLVWKKKRDKEKDKKNKCGNFAWRKGASEANGAGP